MLENATMKITSVIGALTLATMLVACPPPPAILVKITPNTLVQLEGGVAAQFTASVIGAQNTSVLWTLNPNVGSINISGNTVSYTAPNPITQSNNVVLTASSVQDSTKSTSVTIQLRVPTMRVQSAEAILRSIAISTQVQFAATVENLADPRVTWQVVEGTTRGAITADGVYSSPATVPNPATATIRATSISTPSVFGEFQLTIVTSGGISGQVTLNLGLLSAPNMQLQAVRGAPQATPERQFKADWNAPRSRGEVLLVSSNNLQTLSSRSASLRSASSRTEAGLLRVQVPSGTTDKAFAEKLALETGAIVQPNYLYHLLDAPNDTEFIRQGNLVQIDAAGAWFTQVSVPDGLIAVLDTGINPDLPDLAGRVILGKDFCPVFANDPSTAANDPKCLGEDADPRELPSTEGGIGHGTFATGIIAATTNNKLNIAGITQSGKVLAIKVFGSDAQSAIADTVSLSKGIKYAADQGAKVLNLSIGVCAFESAAFETPDKLTENAITYAVGKGAVLVAAAGNNGQAGCDTNPNPNITTNDPSIMFPANNPNVIAVGSVNKDNLRSSFSATGAALDLVAPGESLVSLNFEGSNIKVLSGTSFAAPQVAAIAGLMLAKTPTLTRANIQSILESTAKDLGPAGKDTEYGAGLLQAGAALSKAENINAPTVKTSVYMYADRLRDTPSVGCSVVAATNPDCYDGANAFAGRAIVTINGTSGAVNYSITLSRNGQPLQPGTYRVVACVNKNSNAEACDVGDLGVASNLNLQYTGTNLTGINLTLVQL